MAIEVGSGNVFEDLGLPNPDERLAKARIAVRIGQLLEERGLTQAGAAALMNLAQSDVSQIVRGRLKGFSLDRLIECLNTLDQDVEIIIRPRHPEHLHAQVTVTYA